MYAPHTYTRSFTIDKNIPYPFALNTAVYEAQRIHAPVLVTEWGGATAERLVSIGAEQETHMVNSMYWCWKQNGGGGWSLHSSTDGDHTFTMRNDRLLATSRIHPRAVTGSLRGYRHGNDSFWVHVHCPLTPPTTSVGGGPKGAKGAAGAAGAERLTELYFPPHFAACALSNASDYSRAGASGAAISTPSPAATSTHHVSHRSVIRSQWSSQLYVNGSGILRGVWPNTDGSVVVKVACTKAGGEFFAGSRHCV